MTELGIVSGQKPRPSRRRRRCQIFSIALLLLIITIFLICLILAFTVFKPKNPKTTLLSASVDGVAPRVTLPSLSVNLNVSLDLKILVQNPNHASFRHGAGKTLIYYRGALVGDADVAPGRIPSRGSETVTARVTIEADRFLPDMESLIGDVMAGEVGIDTNTRIPGRVTVLGVIKRHAVALSECHVGIGFPDLKIRRQQCKQRTKL